MVVGPGSLSRVRVEAARVSDGRHGQGKAQRVRWHGWAQREWDGVGRGHGRGRRCGHGQGGPDTGGGGASVACANQPEKNMD